MHPVEPGAGWTEGLGSHATNPPEPRTSGEVLHALGRSWTVSSCEHALKAQFEQWVRGNAKAAAREIAREQGDQAGDHALALYIGQRAAGHYSWNGKFIRSALADVPGLRHLLYLLLRRCQPDVSEEQAEAIFLEDARAAGDAVRWALGNPQAPAAGPGTAAPRTMATPTPTAPRTLDTP